MTRILYASILLPFGLLVWRPEWTSVAALALWVVLALALILYTLVSEWLDVQRARERSKAVDAQFAPLLERVAALEAAQKKTAESVDGLVNARAQQRKGPTL